MKLKVILWKYLSQLHRWYGIQIKMKGVQSIYLVQDDGIQILIILLPEKI